jgi:hypothetical protein
MAQIRLRHQRSVPKGKSDGATLRLHTFSNGAPKAQWRTPSLPAQGGSRARAYARDPMHIGRQPSAFDAREDCDDEEEHDTAHDMPRRPVSPARRAWWVYQNGARLFGLCGAWPQPPAVRDRWLRDRMLRPMSMQPFDPPNPPSDMPADRVAAVKRELERQGWTIIRSSDGERWCCVRLGGRRSDTDRTGMTRPPSGD